MTKARFLARRRPSWRRLEKLLFKAENRRVSRLSGEEVSEFSRLFREICYDLATVRSRDWGKGVERYLNDMVTRAHNLFYRSPPGKPREVVRFVTQRFPRLVRANIRYFLVALVLFYGPGVVCGVVVGRDPALASRILPGTMQTVMDQMYAEDLEEREGGGGEALMTGFYVQHNVGIAFKCYAMGIFLGAGTVYILISNSMILGTVSGFLVARGHGERFFSFVISHGSFELTAIVIAGMAGLVLGHALIHPGPYGYAEAFRRRGLVSLQLAIGSALMLGVAAVIEGFWSPSPAPKVAKFIVGGLLWVVVALYLGLAGREKAR